MRRNYKKNENTRFVSSDKIVGLLGEFPELTKAVREGDLVMVSILCAQLFELNSEINPTRTPPQIAA